METIIPRNNPNDEAMTQDNEVKQPYQMATPDNTAGNQSGETTLIGAPISVDLNASYGLNVAASTDNRSAKFKAPQASQDQGAGANQY